MSNTTPEHHKKESSTQERTRAPGARNGTDQTNCTTGAHRTTTGQLSTAQRGEGKGGTARHPRRHTAQSTAAGNSARQHTEANGMGEGGGGEQPKKKRGGGKLRNAKTWGTRGRKRKNATASKKRGTEHKRAGNAEGIREASKKKGGDRRKQRVPRPRAPRPGSKKRRRQRRRRRRQGGGGRKNKRKKKQPKQGQLKPGGGRAKKKDKTAKRKVRRTKTRQGGQPAQPGQEEHARAHTRGARAWRPLTQIGRCWRPHGTVLVHRPSLPSKDGRYGKRYALVTGSTHAKPQQRTQPKIRARGTRQGQPRCGAPNGYDAERAQRPCLGRSQ